MNIYFTASTSENKELQDHYKKIITTIKKKNNLLSGEQIIHKETLNKDLKISATDIFNRQKELINKADLIIAEVTVPSSGVGGEIVYALTNNKPVLALVYKENDDQLSPLIAGNPSENLYLEHYELDNLEFVINNFLIHISHIQKRKGKLIVIDGGEGSGKATQAELLVEYLKSKKIPVKYYDFPRYYSSFHGETVARFLRGEFGTMDQVSPYLASLAYALDRASVKEEMDAFLQKGGYIITNRYATSNMAHQGAKFKDKKEREAFLKWVYELEYKVHKIPKEDIVIYLYVPWKKGVELTQKKAERKYLNGGTDMAEADIQHRIDSENMYLELTKIHSNWKKIECVKNGELLSKQEIHEEIKKLLSI
jgi:dTMP kinase